MKFKLNISTWTLWSFQKEGSSHNSKLCMDETAALLCPTTDSSSQSVIFRTAELWNRLLSLTEDFTRSGVFWINEICSDGWLWNPNLVLIALAASDRNGIVAMNEGIWWRICGNWVRWSFLGFEKGNEVENKKGKWNLKLKFGNDEEEGRVGVRERRRFCDLKVESDLAERWRWIWIQSLGPFEITDLNFLGWSQF